MTNAPEKIWLWGDGGRTLVSKPHEPYPADAQGYLHTDLHLALVAEAKREARNEARREAVEVLRNCKAMPPEAAILALMEDTGDE